MTMGDSDAEVIASSCDDPQQFELIFRRHYRAVYGYAVRAAGIANGGDIAAEVFVRALAARARFDAAFSSARPWLLGIAAHVVADQYRRWERESRALRRLGNREDTAVGFESEAVDRVAAQTAGGTMRALLGGLHPDERDVVGLFALADMSYQEIAQALHIPEGTVKSRLSRARTRLRNALAPFDQSIADNDEA
jgi:RNA polymerase sigma factor (sigma-70 family)